MSESFLGEIHLAAFTYAPPGWALCNGQLLPAMQNQALFSLLGVSYGGDGRQTFGLPNLIGRVPLGYDPNGGAGFQMGQTGGQAINAIGPNNLPPHSHELEIQTSGLSGTVSCSVPACSAPSAANVTSTPGPNTVLTVAEDPNLGIQVPFYCATAPNAALKGFNVEFKGETPSNLTTTDNAGASPTRQIDCRMPFLVMTYIICTSGMYPTRP